MAGPVSIVSAIASGPATSRTGRGSCRSAADLSPSTLKSCDLAAIAPQVSCRVPFAARNSAFPPHEGCYKVILVAEAVGQLVFDRHHDDHQKTEGHWKKKKPPADSATVTDHCFSCAAGVKHFLFTRSAVTQQNVFRGRATYERDPANIVTTCCPVTHHFCPSRDMTDTIFDRSRRECDAFVPGLAKFRHLLLTLSACVSSLPSAHAQ